ncbi:DUF397 domain-containing protein [Streptomyces sp. NPDC049627]|uniref:DUF397 domain-containing protein n=1 Tax=Streptomyces sp. NPDC049627 TaxID=3365595 RepID=UPI0037B41B8F
MTGPSTHHWFKSSYSGGSGTECVECTCIEGGILVRDSKREGGAVLVVKSPAWRNFIDAVTQRGLRGR